jgi:hypothetical protein
MLEIQNNDAWIAKLNSPVRHEQAKHLLALPVDVNLQDHGVKEIFVNQNNEECNAKLNSRAHQELVKRLLAVAVVP